jgi:hypothetical protein
MTTTQMMFPGQAAAPEGPVDMTMMYVMHHGFRRDLTTFVEAAKATPVDDRPTWQALAARWDLFSRILQHHHSGEDAGLWPLLLSRCDEDERATLEAMEAEHDEIDPTLAACADGFARLAEHADEDARAALAVRLSAAREGLGRHLAHEESGALPIAQRWMTSEEWLELEEAFFRKAFGPKEVLELVPWAAYGTPADLRRRVLAQAGPANRVVLALTRRGFERRERAAFAHVA